MMRVLALLLLSVAAAGADEPRIFWASDPVLPNETVLLQGTGLGNATVEVTRLGDTAEAASIANTHNGTAERWTPVSVVQPSNESLKFVVPADWKPGVFSVRVRSGDESATPLLLNTPDVWWMQGDEGKAATPGGWLRVMGKSLSFGGPVRARLTTADSRVIELDATRESDAYSLRFDIPGGVKPGTYTVSVSNGLGGAQGWGRAGQIAIIQPPAWPTKVFDVLASAGPKARQEMRESLNRYKAPIDHTQGVLAALAKAKDHGGGVVFFPAGKYRIAKTLDIPPRTVLKGEGQGLVVLWWGTGRFSMDGGTDMASQSKVDDESIEMKRVLNGTSFGLEDLSLYVPRGVRSAIVSEKRFRMARVRVRIDRAWLGNVPPSGAVVTPGENFQITDCDFMTPGEGVRAGRYGVIANNRIAAGKSNCVMGGAHAIIVDDNEFTGLAPTTYVNIAVAGRNILYARNRQRSQFTHQADYTFTFDAGPHAYAGRLAEVAGTKLTLADDPPYVKWATAASPMWLGSVVCIVHGRGTGQYRDVVAHDGRSWTIAKPFDVAPDDTSYVTIVPFSGRTLIVGNTFEDANWVNAGYGTSLDIVCAGNQLVRCSSLLSYGGDMHGMLLPSWHIQYLDNRITEGTTNFNVSGSYRNAKRFDGPITRGVVLRRNVFEDDNFGGITIGDHLGDVVVEHSTLSSAGGEISMSGKATGGLFRENSFGQGQPPRYKVAKGKALVLPSP
jgi:hypothetical protein